MKRGRRTETFTKGASEMGFIFVLLGFVMIVAGIFGHALGLPLAAQVGAGAGGIVFMFIGAVMACMSFYKRTAADMAFVRTGRGGNKVVLDGGAMVFPIFH